MPNWPHTFSVIPQIPPAIESIRELAYNLWWCWNDDAVQLFRRLDPDMWEVCGHNPALLLKRVRQSKLMGASSDSDFCDHLKRVVGQWQAYRDRKDRWYRQNYPEGENDVVAYFSAEFGFHESLPIYSGGLGILAGDHCKSASDLGIPFIAVGLLYRLGYFKQRINKEGWQESESVTWDFNDLPISEVRVGDDKRPLLVQMQLPGRAVQAKVWEVKIGTVRLLLLDTDVPENSEDDRRITYQLYGGDMEMRLKQEIVLGVGGVHAIQALGYKPAVYHMNEGHAAFLSLERARRMVIEDGLTFHEAMQPVSASNLFTTHTPVPAGNDAFSPELMGRYFGDFTLDCKISFEDLMRLGRPADSRPGDPFSMTILALRTSRHANGVSAIHGRVSREMWQIVWPGVPREEVPIDHVTNGIHTLTWMAPEIRALFEKAGGKAWEDRLAEKEAWKCLKGITDDELWLTHQQLKLKLVKFVRSNLRQQRLRAGFNAEDILATEEMLDTTILTIGFARRFATYKRAGLLFRDLTRLQEIVNHPHRPVQFIFAGKAHPADEGGKKLIQRIYQVAQMPGFKNRIVFVENYDINVARHMYHGVDVWLNTPTRPLEASGTSGEKVAPNGGLNLSVRDGWWDEAYDGSNGWAVGQEINSSDPQIQDEFDAVSLYDLLEHHVAPLFYGRNEQNLPREWMRWVRHSIETVAPEFNTLRMVQDYTRKFYRQATEKRRLLRDNNFEHSKALAAWKERIRKYWGEVKAKDVNWRTTPSRRVHVGEEFAVECSVYLGELRPEEVWVEACVQPTSGIGQMSAFRLQTVTATEPNWYRFSGAIKATDSGTYQFNVCVLPYHPHFVSKHEMHLITWSV